ncbi:TBC1 domain family member 22A isoform X3 [Hippopotamus amphibius kiboko]|uniref:TBC1 domain family member 22A isoform X3 n=1 Tax=Hippopotamus amphibius kiboko TaxID=575201 RepID=UPI0025995DAA|nr:TBC1 domain family member 22A isoform X3 [Hippopotamus amphibius kiboko]
MASDGARKQFWKRSNSKVPGSIQHVYGAQHPPFDPLLHGTLLKATPKAPSTPVKAKRVSTFQEFESNTSDAWDAGEDDDELLAMAAESLNTAVVMEAANRVLRNHSQRQGSQQPLAAPGPEQQPKPSAEPPSVPSGDLRLVKSVSESHTASPAEELRKLSWSGIPKPVRAITWKLLSGYLPANVDRRPATLQRKQKEYFAFIDHYYDSRNDAAHQDTYRQIRIDLPRMSPEALILQPKVTEIFERILFIWAIRHPASGYVQGINDLVTPFFVVFICEHIDDEDVDTADVSRVPADALRNVEADTYWCMSRLLDGIQDNYTFAQPGIQMKVKMLEELVSRIDVGTRGLRAFPFVRVRCFSREMEERNTGRKRFSRAAALPAEPAHGPLGRRGRQPAAGRGLPPEVCLRGRPQSLQEMSPGLPQWAPGPDFWLDVGHSQGEACWNGGPGRGAGCGPGPGEGRVASVF